METIGNHLEPLRAILFQISAFLPRLVVGLIVVAIGWLVAKAARLAVIKTLRAFNFNVLFERSGLDNFLRQGGTEKDMIYLFGGLVFWSIVLISLLIASTTMGLTASAQLLSRLVHWLPNLFIALLVLALGSYFGRFVGTTIESYCRNAKVRDGRLLGRVAQYLIMAFIVVVALDQTGVGGPIVRQSFLVILCGVVFALALAFGLGGRRWAADRIDSWWPRERGEPQPPADARGMGPGTSGRGGM